MAQPNCVVNSPMIWIKDLWTVDVRIQDEGGSERIDSVTLCVHVCVDV